VGVSSVSAALASMPTRGLTRSQVFPRLLQRWSYGVVIGSAAVAILTLCIRGVRDPATLHVIVGVSLGALVWSYGLMRLSRRIGAAHHVEGVLWTNSLVVLALMTATLIATGGCMSPLAWLYLALIIAELLQDLHRGVIAAWLCWLMHAVTLVVQAMGWLPCPYGVVSAWPSSLITPTWLLHALSLNLWYLVIAVAVSLLARWFGGCRQALEEERAATQAAQQECGIQAFQLDEGRRRFEEERARWEQERLNWNVQQLQAAQRIAAQEAAVAQRARELDEIKRHFESQHVQTTQLFMQLEGTLTMTVKRISEEVRSLEAKYREIEETRRHLLVSQP
jgi:hypothetical protein